MWHACSLSSTGICSMTAGSGITRDSQGNCSCGLSRAGAGDGHVLGSRPVVHTICAIV